MVEQDWLAERFEDNRAHLQAVGFRMLGSRTDADDAVQESWLRLSRSDTSAVSNLDGWPTTVVTRVRLDMLRSRRAPTRVWCGTGGQPGPPAADRRGSHDRLPRR